MVSKNVLGQAVIFLTARHQTPVPVLYPVPDPVPGFETVWEGFRKGLQTLSEGFKSNTRKLYKITYNTRVFV